MLSDVRAILHLTWPLLIGQLAAIAFGVIDTAMVGRFSAQDLAALGLGGSIYISVYVALFGILAALSPIAGNLFGAGRLSEIGETVRQSAWLALGLSALGTIVLYFPEPLLRLSDAPPVLAERATGYLRILSFGLPASLAFRIYGGVSTAIGRPRFVMGVQIVALLVKVPANYWLIFGGLGVPAMGGLGCALASTAINWIEAALGAILLARGQPYRPLAIFSRFSWPSVPQLGALLRLGLPMGLSYLIEVTSYTFMAIFITRFGTATLAAHQIAGNVGAVLYMTPLSIGIATATLVAQALGAEERDRARTISRHGILLAGMIGLCYAVLVAVARHGIAAAYTNDTMVAGTAAGLLLIVAAYHCFDAVQVTTSFVLRSYRVTVVPTVIYAIALWGVGLGGGYVMGFNTLGMLPAWLTRANGFWIANTASLAVAAAMLVLYRRVVVRR
ncbi:MAG: MATE family efflux transporter [Janthinobacterium lividum]